MAKKKAGINSGVTSKVLRACLAANIPVKLESWPGAGKTSVLNAMFGASDGYLHTMVAVTHDPTDFGGIPVPDQEAGQYRLLPGSWAVDLSKATDKHPLVGLFLDEVNTAGRAVLAACLKVVDERRVGYFALPSEVRIMLAMNPAEANGGVDLTPAMANRVAHLPFHIPEQEWADGLVNGFTAPEPIVVPDEAELGRQTKVHASGLATFLSADTARVDAYPDNALDRSKAWPSRRTWTMGARLMAACDVLGYDSNVRAAALESLVGASAAAAYFDWQERMSIDTEPLFSDPKNAPLPTEEDMLFAVLLKLGEQTKERNTQEAVDSCVQVLARVFDDRPGVAAASIQNVARWLMDNPALAQSPAVRESLRTFAPVLQGGGDDQE